MFGGLIIRGVRRQGRFIVPAAVTTTAVSRSKKTLLLDSTVAAVAVANNSSTPNNPSLSSLSNSSSSNSLRYYSSINTTKIAERVERMLLRKAKSKLSYDDIAKALGVTNTYAAQLLLGQAKLTSSTAEKLREVLPYLDDYGYQLGKEYDKDIQSMQNDFPMRTFDTELLKEPNIYRTYEALLHNGEAIKTIINEQCGDGIMSAIDFYCDVGTTTGTIHGEKRVVITFNGKFLPFIEQSSTENSAKSPRD
ncbi:Cyanate_lyase-domain-containing protein [Fragilariopsis cylindrus CCMP1102]|uniref:Cyanate_lyase-domain-containing protein n=1 Tax=Fragilariopsis cylindrus CCMP1102 TaxID=635003 RepID=A0A1E7FJ81_9STRA|nr:Cyanate_lyase-domain-containing protein [Fragilariopsis cylindrus CCMP1102]|eukprot:OEU18226.1 Cyanate_lyase-domain-containing protein [Fragilariopsis cylindrus CCMP1102]